MKQQQIICSQVGLRRLTPSTLLASAKLECIEGDGCPGVIRRSASVGNVEEGDGCLTFYLPGNSNADCKTQALLILLAEAKLECIEGDGCPGVIGQSASVGNEEEGDSCLTFYLPGNSNADCKTQALLILLAEAKLECIEGDGCPGIIGRIASLGNERRAMAVSRLSARKIRM
jgi:hypothetical protein